MTGLELTLADLRTHLAAVASPRYEVRLIDSAQRACCATRYWTAGQLLAPTTARFLRARNRAGCEVYFRPHAGADSAGYLLLDFDAGPCPLADLRAATTLPASWSKPVRAASRPGCASAPKPSARVGPLP